MNFLHFNCKGKFVGYFFYHHVVTRMENRFVCVCRTIVSYLHLKIIIKVKKKFKIRTKSIRDTKFRMKPMGMPLGEMEKLLMPG